MRRILALFGSFLFFCLAPGTVAGLLPWLIGHWRVQPDCPAAFRAAGAVLIVLGLIPLVESFARFAWKGLGTPAPILPTRHLVVSGFYRHVRNPMYVGVVAVILGQAALFCDSRLAVYGATVWFVMHLFVVFYEEPKLAQTFGADYARFRANVPRWLPRLKGWKG